MILEYAQLLSTAHRVLDGKESIEKTKTNRNVKRWKLNDSRDSILYAATHINHPSAVWARKNQQNYIWLTQLLKELCKEYTYRYERTHKVEEIGLLDKLSQWPNNIPMGEFTEPTPAMPEDYKVAGDSIKSYHNYYNGDKQRMFSWKKREVPYFITK